MGTKLKPTTLSLTLCCKGKRKGYEGTTGAAHSLLLMGEDETEDTATAWFQTPLHLK